MTQKDVGIRVEQIEERIFLIRGHKVMLDRHLAELYAVETKQLKRSVRRNAKRFPGDFMFELTKTEFDDLRRQFGTSSWGGSRYPPMAFTEQGVAMLSSVLNSDRAIEVNIEIMRAFLKLRQMLDAHKDLRRKLAELEKKYDDQIKIVFEAIAELMVPPEQDRKEIGFELKEKRRKHGKKNNAL